MRIKFLANIIVTVLILGINGAFGSLESDVEWLLNRVKKIEDKEKHYVSTIEKLQVQLGDQAHRIQKLEDDAALKETIIDELQRRISILKNESNEHVLNEHPKFPPSQLVIAEENVNDKKLLGEVVEKHEKGIYRHSKTEQKTSVKARNRRQQFDIVAFLAVAEASKSHLGSGQNIAFETVLLNLGDGYHNLHGVFLAPTSGVYVFSVTMLNPLSGIGRCDYSLMKNGNTLSNVIADGRNDNYNQGSVTVTTQLDEGDEVWVEVAYPQTDADYNGYRFSSFTGFMLTAL